MTFPVLPLYQANAEFDPALSVVGKAAIIFNGSNANEIISVSKYSKIQIYVDLQVTELSDPVIDDLVNLFNNGVVSVFTDAVTSTAILEKIPNARVLIKSTDFTSKGFVFASSEVSIEDLQKFIKTGAIPVINASKLTTEYENVATGSYSVVEFIKSLLVTDRQDSLYTTLVTDASNQSLGLVYSSTKSISEAIKTQTGVYQSRKHGLWYKGATSGSTQKLLSIDVDCDADCLKVVVEQSGTGFCHLETASCFGELKGLAALEKTLVQRKQDAPEGSYTKRLFDDEKLLKAKIKEEAEELTDATSKEEIAWEAADLFYFALTRCVKYGISIADIEKNLDMKALKVSRRKGDAKAKFLEKEEEKKPEPLERIIGLNDKIYMNRVNAATATAEEVAACLERPIQKSADIMSLVTPIVNKVKNEGNKALLELTAKFDRVELENPVLFAPFDESMMQVSEKVKKAIDVSFENIRIFHEAQNQTDILTVETSPGVYCSRFARPIERVGCYIPGGTAVLPSTSLMLSVPALVAGCKDIIFASPPGKDGMLTPEVVYVAHKVGAKCIVLAGGAQAVAAMAYGTETIPKCDKIMGPGNQFVTAAKMLVANDSNALCAIDMPAGPSEVLVIADKHADPDFVASDLLSQAEHGIDSQVILLAVDMTDEEVDKIDEAVDRQALALPRVEIVRKCIAHSTTIQISTMEEAFNMSNRYAPEHLILQIQEAESWVPKVDNAGSVFVGALSPESMGDYSSGTNHTLPTYGYARMYSGVNTATFQKFITSQVVTKEGLKNIGCAVMDLAEVEGLDGHRNAVRVRMDKLGLLPEGY